MGLIVGPAICIGSTLQNNSSVSYFETEAEYIYRKSGGSDAISSGKATMSSIKGKSIVWNQKANGNFSSNRPTKLSYDASTQTYTVLAIVNDYTTAYYALGAKGVDGHKYYFRMRLTPSSDCSVKWSTGGYATTANSRIYQLYAGKTNALTRIESVTNNYQWFGVVAGTVGQTLHADGFEFIDLTLMFGAGNEPSTVAEFEAMYPLPYYAYNAGEIVSNKATAIETTGWNQWDEEWELGQYHPTTGEKMNSSTNIRSKNYIPVLGGSTYYGKTPSQLRVCTYDANKNYIGIIYGGFNNTIVQLGDAVRFITLCTTNGTTTSYNHDICINLSDPAKNGTYQPYEKHTLNLNLPTLTGKLNGEGTSVTICSDGLKSARTVYDEGIVENGYLTKIVKRIGVVDMGTLEWSYKSQGFFSASNALPLAKRISNNNDIANILCSKYNTASAYSIYTGSANNAIGVENSIIPNVRVRDNTAGSDAATFKTTMSGVILYYELATPQTYILDTPIPVKYRVYNGGTEERLPKDTSSSVSAPVKYTVLYPKPKNN